MGKLRITASKAFTLEMVRTALLSSAIPSQYRLTGMWMSMDMEMGSDSFKRVVIMLLIRGVTSRVEAFCNIENDGDGWVRGTCRIELVDDRSRAWEFHCQIEDDRISQRSSSTPLWLYSVSYDRERQEGRFRFLKIFSSKHLH